MLIEFDPEEGYVVPDGKVREFLLQMHEDDYPLVRVGSQVMVDMARLLYLQGKIPRPTFLYKDVEIQIDELDAGLDRYIRGFADIFDDILIEIGNFRHIRSSKGGLNHGLG